MKLTRFGSLVFAAAAAAALATPARAQEPTPAPAPPAVNTPPKTYYEAYQVEVKGKAKATGAIVVVFQTLGGEPKSLNVNVLAKTGEKDIAKDIAKELTIAAGTGYKVKTKSGTRVIVSKASKTSQNLNISLGGQTVPGVVVSFGEN